MAEFSVVGKRIPRVDAHEQVTGRLVYGDDMYRPNMLFAQARYADHPHARILGMDVSQAKNMSGVRAIVTYKDVPHNRYGFNIHDQRVLVDDKVRYRGDCIAVVAADTQELARSAADAIKVEYEVLQPLLSPVDAMREGAPLIHGDQFDTNVPVHLKLRLGDAEEGFAQCSVVHSETYSTQKVDHAPMEPHVALAEIEPDGTLVITTSTSRVFHYVGILTMVLQMPMTKLRVKSAAVGGAFGGKNEVMLEPWVGLLALKTGRPVKMTYSRKEDLCTSTVRHAYVLKYKMGAAKDGRLLAAEIEIIADGGAYAGLSKSTLTKAMVHATGPYFIPNVKVDGYVAYTNALIASSMRGMGVPQVCFAVESHMDAMAQQLDMSPEAFRRINLFGEHGNLPNGQVVNTKALRLTFERALTLYDGECEKEGDAGG